MRLTLAGIELVEEEGVLSRLPRADPGPDTWLRSV